MKAYIEVAEEFNKPIIIAYSGNFKTNFLTLEDAAVIGRYYAEKAKVPVCLHIDHGYNLDFIKKAIDLGFTSVMIDGSNDSYDVNVKKTKEIVDYAKGKNVSVEAEIGHVGSGQNYENEEENDSIYTDVKECIDFVEATGINSVAVSIGTAHGIYTGGHEAPSLHQILPDEIHRGESGDRRGLHFRNDHQFHVCRGLQKNYRQICGAG